MISKLLYFYIYVTLLSINNIDGSYSVCGNWQTYRDEKCIKIFSTEKFVTFDEALKSCSQIDNSSQILTIHSKEEQDFLIEYLVKTQKLVDNIWIGLRNKTQKFEWTDSSTKPYTYWKKENPTNEPDYNCVQLEPDSLQWINERCIKKSLVVCQKLPEVTLSDLFRQILETKDKLKLTENKLKVNEERLTKTESELKKAKDILNKTEDQVKKSVEDLKEAKEEIKVMKEELKVTQNKRNEIFNNKNVSHYHLFTDINGKNKAFIILLDGMTGNTFDDSVNLCKNFNSTLIEIESKEKQFILESFLSRLGNEFLSQQFRWVWINGLRDSSGVWKWLNSNTTFTFTNWGEYQPSTYSSHNNILFETYSSDTFGKWFNVPKTNHDYVMCEHSFGF